MQRYLMLALAALCLPVFAAPALVQNTAPCFSTSAVLSETCSFSTLPTVGDVVVVGYSLGTSTTGVTKVTDNQTNGYVMEDNQPQNGSQASAFWCSVVQVSSGTFTVTVTPNGNQYVSMVLLEYSGVSCNPDTAPVAATNATSPFTVRLDHHHCGNGCAAYLGQQQRWWHGDVYGSDRLYSGGAAEQREYGAVRSDRGSDYQFHGHLFTNLDDKRKHNHTVRARGTASTIRRWKRRANGLSNRAMRKGLHWWA